MKNFFLSIVTLLTLISVIFTNDQVQTSIPQINQKDKLSETTQINCPAIGYFMGKSHNGLGKMITNRSGFCTNLTKTCCGVDDFISIQKWWQDPIVSTQNSNGLSRLEKRAKSQENVYYFTKEIIEKREKIFSIAEKILSKESKSDEFCLDSAKRVLRHEFPQNFMNKIKKETQICWNFLNELQVSLMCSACDPKAQEHLDFENGRFTVNEDTYRKYEVKCFSTLRMNVHHIYPYLRLIEHLSRCDQNGQKNNFKNQVFHTNVNEIITSKIYNSIPKKEFSKLISFGEKLNINSEGDELYLIQLLANLKEQINDQNMTLPTKKAIMNKIKNVTTEVALNLHKERKFSAYEAKERLENYISGLKEEQLSKNEIHSKYQILKDSLNASLYKTEKVNLDNQNISNSIFPQESNKNSNNEHQRRRLLEENEKNSSSLTNNESEQNSDSMEAEDYEERELAEEKEKKQSKLEKRIIEIKNDIKTKFDDYPMPRFEKWYPPPSEYIKAKTGEKKNFQSMYKDIKIKWRTDWHLALIHYIECDDFDLYSPKKLLDDEKPHSQQVWDDKKNCKDKVKLDKSVKDMIKTIPYPPNKKRKVLATSSKDADEDSDDNKASDMVSKCLDIKILEAFDTQIEGLDEKGVYTKEEKDEVKDNRIRRLEVLNASVKANKHKEIMMKPHKNDTKIWKRIRKLAQQNGSRGLATRSSRSNEMNLNDLLEKAHDKHRILSMMRYNENRKFTNSKKKNLKLKKDRKLAKKEEKKKNEDKKKKDDDKKKKDDDKKESDEEQPIEDGGNFDDATRVLSDPPKATWDSEIDMTHYDPKEHKNRNLDKKEKKSNEENKSDEEKKDKKKDTKKRALSHTDNDEEEEKDDNERELREASNLKKQEDNDDEDEDDNTVRNVRRRLNVSKVIPNIEKKNIENMDKIMEKKNKQDNSEPKINNKERKLKKEEKTKNVPAEDEKYEDDNDDERDSVTNLRARRLNSSKIPSKLLNGHNRLLAAKVSDDMINDTKTAPSQLLLLPQEPTSANTQSYKIEDQVQLLSTVEDNGYDLAGLNKENYLATDIQRINLNQNNMSTENISRRLEEGMQQKSRAKGGILSITLGFILIVTTLGMFLL